MEIPDILRRYKVIAVVGLSRDESKYSNKVSRFMQSVGYRIIPVNPEASVLLGEKVYKSLANVPADANAGIVDVFRPGNEALGITKQAVGIGAKVVWLQEGIMNDDAKAYAEEHGLGFVQNRCIMKEYEKLQE
ncbi:MAG: CoA-binding protein [Candidatus Marsarchaeota archaeon]|nr:CoA-binding protein [Candidatus Marsarchaeota archaeon]MCL5413391.1 CoA-binding protein [Candidatus Marsarchaeota archaeon]